MTETIETVDLHMPLYQGTKQLHARPMTLGDYSAYRGWTKLSGDEGAAAPGYLVEYVDGGKPNHPDHEGYISWSPADVFEQHYKLCGSFLDRLTIERAELNERATKLSDFIHSAAFQSVGPVEHNLLLIQLDAMNAYLKTLSTRISDLQNVPPSNG